MAKFIFVTGGVVSGLGKGITAASLGRLLKCRGLKVASQKLDPYVNVDPGTMSPLQHGEVFVTDDGTETDLDLGHYERFIDENLNKYSNLTTGKVYWNVLNKERQGAYLGQTVQIIPHITNEIKSYIYNLASSTEADVVITEIGGTTGDIESQPFLEAIRQVGLEQGKENCCFIHVVLVPYISGSDEYKSKPAQHSVKELQGMGVSPDIIILRADGSVGSDIRRKISTFCNVKPECVIENLTMPSLYQCPLMLHTGGLDDVVVKQLHLDVPPADLTEWKEMLARIATRSKTCTIALVGKYVKLHDAYLSVMESLYHAGFENDSQVEIKWVESEDLPDQAACKEAFADVDGIIVPGGFGQRLASPEDTVAAGDGFGTAQSDDGDGSARSGGGSDDGIGRDVHRRRLSADRDPEPLAFPQLVGVFQLVQLHDLCRSGSVTTGDCTQRIASLDRVGGVCGGGVREFLLFDVGRIDVLFQIGGVFPVNLLFAGDVLAEVMLGEYQRVAFDRSRDDVHFVLRIECPQSFDRNVECCPKWSRRVTRIVSVASGMGGFSLWIPCCWW